MKKIRKTKEKKLKPIIAPEYYLLTWANIHLAYRDELYKSYIVEPTQYRKSIAANVFSEFNNVNRERQYSILNDLLMNIECELKNIIKKRPAFYWIHIYRRIAPCLGEDLGGNTTESTTVTVRNHAEQAILKYGSLSKTEGYALSNAVGFEDILGGLFKKHLSEKLSNENLNKFWGKFKSSTPQWVITDFTERDIMDMYRIEGFSYQYWYVSAKMRAIGKEVLIEITQEGDIKEIRTPEQEYLITSFDNRDVSNSPQFGLTSNVGTLVPSNINSIDEVVFCAFINAGRHTAKELSLTQLPKEFSPNYIPWFINANKYFQSHKYLSLYFEKKFNFGLLELCQAAIIISRMLVFKFNSKIKNVNSMDLFFYAKFQRGYVFYGDSFEVFKVDLAKEIESFRKQGGIIESRLENQINEIIEFLTLDESKQNNLGIWSNGPRFVFIKVGGNYVCDYSSWHSIFTNLFFGLRNYDPQSVKGGEFEYTFSELARESGFNVLVSSKIITCDKGKREIDVAIRIDDDLYLFECRAFERPLNFMIGNLKTIRNRNSDLLEKLKQASSLAEFIAENKIGDNYDFSWAVNIYSAVVSPYTEWIWSDAPYLWTEGGDFPRVMSAQEAIEYLRSKLVLESSKEDNSIASME